MRLHQSAPTTDIANAVSAPDTDAPSQAVVQDEAGFSMVEVMVSTMVLSLGIMGALGLFVTASRASIAARNHTQASQLATSQMEELRASDYVEVYIAEGGPGYQTSYNGLPTFSDSSASSGANGAVATNYKATINDQVFAITTHVTWDIPEAAADDESEDVGYKVLNVIVEWLDSTGPHRIEQESGIFARSNP